MHQLPLNRESAAVLLRCLAYGENTISMAEVKSGVASVIEENTSLLRKQVSSRLAEEIILTTARERNDDSLPQ